MTLSTGLTFDAIVIPSGGLNKAGEPHDFVKTRIDWAGQLDKLYFDRQKKSVAKYWISSGLGTPFKAPVTDEKGQPVSESRADALYLKQKWDVHGKIFLEAQSKDSLGKLLFR